MDFFCGKERESERETEGRERGSKNRSPKFWFVFAWNLIKLINEICLILDVHYTIFCSSLKCASKRAFSSINRHNLKIKFALVVPNIYICCFLFLLSQNRYKCPFISSLYIYTVSNLLNTTDFIEAIYQYFIKQYNNIGEVLLGAGDAKPLEAAGMRQPLMERNHLRTGRKR